MTSIIMVGLSVYDYAGIGLVLILAVTGAVRGLSKEVAGVFKAAGILVGAYFLFHPAAEWLSARSSLNPALARAAALLIVLLLLTLLFSLLARLLAHLLQLAFEGFIERIGGFLAGALKGLILLGLLYTALFAAPGSGPADRVIEESVLGRHYYEYLPRIYEEATNALPH